jgi:hypothetical protein
VRTLKDSTAPLQSDVMEFRAGISQLKATCSAWICGILETFQQSSSTFTQERLALWDFPALFEDFKRKKCSLLWRGSRDGFGARDFHNRCERHTNTVTVILDADGNIFGGFTSVKWEFRTLT